MDFALVWSDELAGYRFRPGHPLDPRRLQLTMSLIRAMGLVDDDQIVAPGPGTDMLVRRRMSSILGTRRRLCQDAGSQPLETRPE